jgi:hypothetical protein
VYVESDDQHLFDSLAGKNRFLQAAQHMFAAESQDRWLNRIACSKGRLWMVIGCSDGFSRGARDRDRDFAARLLPHLQSMQADLDACMPDSKASERDRYLLPAVVLLALSTGLAVNGVIAWTRSFLSPEFLLDTETFRSFTLGVATCVVGVLALAALISLRGSSRLHLVLIELALVGTFGAWSTSSSVLRDINIEFDMTPAVRVHKSLLGKSIKEDKRLFRATRRTYLLHHQGWSGDARGRTVSVSASTYEKASPGDMLEFEQHQGFMGWRWARFTAWIPAGSGKPAT